MVALDVDELSDAETLVSSLKNLNVTYKIGNQLGTFEGWRTAIEFAQAHDAKIFCDTKFKDIPETVKKSARAITRLQPDFFNIMTDNSPAALRAAVAGIDSAMSDFGLKKRPILLGVTVLTSISDTEARSIYGADSETKVIQFASAAAEAGLDGIVCSAHEAKVLKQHEATRQLLIVTPGIRPVWASSGDQSRVMTPQDAIEAGADYLVIGRPITSPPDAVGTLADAYNKIIKEIS